MNSAKKLKESDREFEQNKKNNFFVFDPSKT
jgi:hypothetical protein